MKMETKREVFERYKKEYFAARTLKKGGRKKLTNILDTIEQVTGMQRKSILRRLRRLQGAYPNKEERRGRALYYTPDVTAALKDIWEAGGEVCGELLHPMVGEYVTIFLRDNMWHHRDRKSVV